MQNIQINGSPVTVGIVYRDVDGDVIPASNITGTVANADFPGIVTLSVSSDNTALTITPVADVSGRCRVQLDASMGSTSFDAGQINVHVVLSDSQLNPSVDLVS